MTREIKYVQSESTDIITDITFETAYPDVNEEDHSLFSDIYDNVEKYRKCAESVGAIQKYTNPTNSDEVKITDIFNPIEKDDELMSDILSYIFNRLIAEQQKMIGETMRITAPQIKVIDDCEKSRDDEEESVDVETTAEPEA